MHFELQFLIIKGFYLKIEFINKDEDKDCFMLNVAIVEDEVDVARQTEKYLNAFADEHGIIITTRIYNNADSFLNDYKNNFDLVFMDIELPGTNGLDASVKLREMDKNVMIVFVTNLMQYAVKGYFVNAFDFIVKPFNYEDFAIKLKRIFKSLLSNQNKKVIINYRGGKKVVSIFDILYVEVNKHVLVYHLKKENIVTSGTLKKVIEEINDSNFALCNQCYLVNLRFVKEISDNTVIVGNDSLQISAPKRKEFCKALTKYLCNSGGNSI